MLKNKLFKYFFCVFFIIFTNSVIIFANSDTKKNNIFINNNNKLPLKLTFAGDIMAHKENFSVEDFSKAYQNVKDFLIQDDLTFANFESPVCNSVPYSSYPSFNVHTEYAQASINAGFDVFSLANNHTNDQKINGIEQTLRFFTRQRSQEVYSAGIKDNTFNSISYDIIEKNGWRILFCAITEILNDFNNCKKIDYYPSTKNSREKLINDLIQIKKKHPCDLFILSIHSNEPEYELEVSQKRKKWYYELLNYGVDIIWSNHQHVSQEWEVVNIKNTDGSISQKLIMYCLGNFLSGQRRYPNYNSPEQISEYKGDSYLLQVTLDSNKNFTKINPIYITTHIELINSKQYFLVKQLNENFINQLKNSKIKKYYSQRLMHMNKIKGTTIWLKK